MTSPVRPLWIGTYPSEGSAPGSGEGVWRVDVDPASGALTGERLVAEVAAPSFLALHPSGRTLYAVTETADGSLSTFAVDGDALTATASVPSGGDDPCHVVADDEVVWVANYSSGTATVLPVADDGALLGPAVTHAHAGSGPVADRQGGPHAHLVALHGDDALVVDLGTDELRRYARVPGDAADAPAGPSLGSSVGSLVGSPGGPGGPVAATLPAGAGPRHLVPLPGGHLAVVGELDCRLHVLAPVPGARPARWTVVASTPATAAAPPAAPGSPSFPSHVSLTPDGRHVVVGIRGADVLAVHRVDLAHDGTPVLVHRADVALGAGAWPRHHAVLAAPSQDDAAAEGAEDGADVVVVALQGTSELVSVRLDRATGAGEVVARLALPVPSCVLEA